LSVDRPSGKLARDAPPPQNVDVASYAASLPTTDAPVSARGERVLRVRAAGFPRRLAAAIIDLTLLAAVTLIVVVIAALVLDVPIPRGKALGPDLLLAGVLDRNPMAVGGLGLFLGLGALYQIYFGGLVGQTVGKRCLRLRVISVRGTTPGPIRGIVRYLALLLAVLPAGLGWLWCLFDREHRAAHDHLAGTYVIIDE
jgi:uncharacterized RDD family membrane protein YckC